MSGEAERAARRTARLARLERIAEMQARAARQRLAAAAMATRAAEAALAAHDDGRRAALARPPEDPASATALGAWLRWAAAERRRLTIDQAARLAEADGVRQESARAIARHVTLTRLRERGEANGAARRRS